jgi:hypothetical protein
VHRDILIILYKCLSNSEDNIKTDLKEILREGVERIVQEYVPVFTRSETTRNVSYGFSASGFEPFRNGTRGANESTATFICLVICSVASLWDLQRHI